jgi:hypothetical protein
MKMKNKKAEQLVAKEKHKSERNAAKERKNKLSPLPKRGKERSPDETTFLIVTEGQNTEPSYFN